MTEGVFSALRERLEGWKNFSLTARVPEFLPSDVIRAEFYKLDQTTTDLIFCDLMFRDGKLIAIHEDMLGWTDAITGLESLDGFDASWFAKVSQPPFELCNYAAYIRSKPF